MKAITFANPEFFWLFLLFPLLIAWQWFRRKKEVPAVSFSSLQQFSAVRTWRTTLRPLLYVLRGLALAALIVALARPRSSSEITKTKTTEGIDIILSIDMSSSMLAKDLKPNRIEALKRVASQFIEQRTSDRIGIVVYSGESYTKVPATTDKSVVLQALKDIKQGEIEDGTAIGMGLGTAINRLKDSKTKSKVIILMTDGVNNTGVIDPLSAAELAKEYGIRVYTIGIGTNGKALSPVAYNPDGSLQYDMVPVEIDDKLLSEIAKSTGGQYFRATDNKKLAQIYTEIDKLEKSKIEELKYYQHQENFRPWALLALVFLVAEFGLRHTVFRSFV
ncbi:MAG: VWA domain-containing protein [Capnocytophaga sp.]|jgi:batA protein|uniref:vWA domain-containing protein n=1 Tax=Capnocytophaga sp. oral taxon 863 TaxID=1227265 RepID=UPI0003978868|nr:VWA domain-containing protein [Capnocytophaga sp. oral taxon 863]ERI62987.1 von Willebrand factor type A domain protein [Capnocytophaga sp. oral taxon 863 str. F0517]RKW08608.1 MAG: VWA domain-containing protein [Capnocytophaga sp.]